jgi:cytochrome c oxidase accessory protein FixG
MEGKDSLHVSEEFRESIATVDKTGKRIWLYPKKPSGKLYNQRKIVSYLLLAFLVGVPFIKLNGHPLFLFNIIERRFIIFGNVFWPQDFYLFVLGMITFIVIIILFTTVFGRVWCGWACPQTIFMEMIFRRVEYWILGDSVKQKRLREGPWTGEKVQKYLATYSIFMVFSFLIAHTVLTWILGVDKVFEMMTSSPSQNFGNFATMMITTLVIFGIYTRFREQMCTTFCPYGRLQGVLLGNDSMVVAYDYQRGEPRGRMKKRKTEEANLGDCIDCYECVKVCPTGIDIRNGTQLECVNCTACIDACNTIMDKVNKPRDLITFASETNIKEESKFQLTPRMKAYSAVLVVLVGVLFTLAFTRSDIETTILRSPGMLYQEHDDGRISNLYEVQIVNKTFEDMKVELESELEGVEVMIVGESGMINVPSSGEAKTMFFIYIPPEKIEGMKTSIPIRVISDGEEIDKVKTSFVGPNS